MKNMSLTIFQVRCCKALVNL